MQHLISWKQYIIYSGFGLFVYYALIIFKFYRKDILQIKFPKAAEQKINLSSQGTLFPVSVSATLAETAQNPLSPLVHDFVDELKVLLKQSAAQQSGKPEIMIAVIKLLKKYPALKGSSFQGGISNLIAAESETNCNIRLSEDELASVWN